MSVNPKRPSGKSLAAPSLRALAALALPPVAILAGLALAGLLAWPWALGAATLLALFDLLLLARHTALLKRIERRIETFALSVQDESEPMASRDTLNAVLLPGLAETLAETVRRLRREGEQRDGRTRGNEEIFANLPTPLLLLNRKGCIVNTNRAADDLLGVAPAGSQLSALLRDPVVLAAVDRVLAGGRQEETECTLPGRFQRYLKARLAALPTPTSEGTAAVLALEDLTAIKRADQLRADFIANASHELRTPLASLLGFIETLRGPARDDAEARERFLGIMDEQARRMTRLVQDLLSLSRIELEEHTPPPGECDLEHLLRSIATSFEPQAHLKSMRIELDLVPLPHLTGDGDELIQVFQNLLDNAIKYGRKGTAVTLRAERQEAGSEGHRRLGHAGIAISVVDRGEGIPREAIPRLTERFYRVDTARSRKLGGTGLGLAIVKHIVSRHRGLLVIDSEIGKGSTFTVLLPTRHDQKGPSPEFAAH